MNYQPITSSAQGFQYFNDQYACANALFNLWEEDTQIKSRITLALVLRGCSQRGLGVSSILCQR